MLENALALYELGFSVIPLGAVNERPPDYFLRDRCNNDMQAALQRWPKTPRYRWKEFQSRCATVEEIEHWWTLHPQSNIAIITGEVFVVDADSEAAIDWIDAGNLPPTPWRVDTAKGRHYYYLMTPGLQLRNTTNVIKKIDTRGVGGYVVAPGSIHPSGALYEWNPLPGWPCSMISDLTPITQEALDALAHYNNAPVITEDGEESYGDMGAIHLAHDGGPTPDGERNSAATSLAGSYFHQGFSLVETAQLLNQWNALNPEPLPDGDINTVVASVASTATRNGEKILMAPLPGQEKLRVPQPVTDPGTGELFVPPAYTDNLQKQTSVLLDKLLASGELMRSPPKTCENFWHQDLLYRGSRMIIAGDAKIGKSRFALAMAVSAACGKPFLDWSFHKPQRVLWAQAEIDDYHLYDRVRAARTGLTDQQRAAVDQNMLLTQELEIDIFDPAGLAGLHALVEKARPDILIIDPIVNFVAMNENDATDVSRFLRIFDRIKREYHCAVVLVHHNKKRGKGVAPSIDDLRGSTVFRGWADSSIILAGTTANTNLIWDLRHTMLNGGEIQWTDTGYQFAIEADTREAPEAARAGRLDQLRANVTTVLETLAPGEFMSRETLNQELENMTPGLATTGLVADLWLALKIDPNIVTGDDPLRTEFRLVSVP